MFVTFEGPEGAGKTTAISAIAEHFRGAGRTVVTTREPGGSSIGKDVRRLLLEGGALTGRAELFLFLADRTQHVHETILPSLEAGALVLCDRFADSTVVYQGYGRGLDVLELKKLNDIAVQSLVPDITFLFDLPVEIGLARITSKDRLDSEPIEFHQKVRQGFLSEAALEPNRWVVLDASKSAEQIANHCIEICEARMSEVEVGGV